jgi:gamma-glutamyltranspeptidase/glutathione hydrolase
MKKSLFAFTASAILFTQAATAENVGVTSSADPRVTEAGMEMLRQGGSAADAAMAMMLALTVVEPQSSGIGGGGFLLYQDSAKNVLTTIHGRETAPAAAKADRFVGPDGKPLGFLAAFQGGHSVGVPGNIRLMAQAHRKWGKLSWATIFKPAIRLADKGFTVNKTLESRLKGIQPLWSNFDAARAI